MYAMIQLPITLRITQELRHGNPAIIVEDGGLGLGSRLQYNIHHQ